MRKIYFLFFLFIQLSLHSQPVMLKITEGYYRSVPFNREFNYFLQHLMNDPTLLNKKINKKTDSTLFFMEGDYSNHNPFFFKTIRTRIVLAEKENIITQDSVNYLHLSYQYQVIGYAPPGEEGRQEVKEEYEKFCKKYKKSFYETYSRTIGPDSLPSGEVTDFSSRWTIYPLTAVWASSKNQQENLFAITVRFVVFNNQPYFQR